MVERTIFHKIHMNTTIEANQPVRFESLGFGGLVTSNTMDRMKQIIVNSLRSYYIRRWAEKIVDFAPDEYSKAETIYDFIVSKCRYIQDPVGLELLKTPQVSLQLIEVGDSPAIDCDDATILIGALVESIGLPYAIRAVSFNNDEFSHIYGLVKIIEKGWIPMDFVVGKKGGYMGDEPQGITRMKDMEV